MAEHNQLHNSTMIAPKIYHFVELTILFVLIFLLKSNKLMRPAYCNMTCCFYCSNIYKLSDFGTAKPVMEEEAFQSLVGTEEYLVGIIQP